LNPAARAAAASLRRGDHYILPRIVLYRINRMSWILRGRELIFGAYENLPNLFIGGSLLLGAITGIIPILILGLVTSFVGILIYGFQLLMHNFLGNDPLALALVSSKIPCRKGESSNELFVTSWASVTTFIVTYIFLNALSIYQLPAVGGANEDLIANRQSYMASVMFAIALIGLILLVTRMKMGCETYFMGIVSIIVGAGAGTGLWNLVSVGGKDVRMGDLFQVRNNMTGIQSSGVTTPVMCIKP
jgi:hypothetical protein